MNRDFNDLSEGLLREFFTFCIGERLGWGVSRETYVFKLNDKYVIKHEYGTEYFQNVIEYKVWEAVADTPYQKFFAPCDRISTSGNFLLQRRVYPLEPNVEIKMPALLTDRKPEHFGMLDGRLVCCDYGTIDVRALDRYFRQPIKLTRLK